MLQQLLCVVYSHDPNVKYISLNCNSVYLSFSLASSSLLLLCDLAIFPELSGSLDSPNGSPEEPTSRSCSTSLFLMTPYEVWTQMLLSQCNDELNQINSDCMALCCLVFLFQTTGMLADCLSESSCKARSACNFRQKHNKCAVCIMIIS